MRDVSIQSLVLDDNNEASFEDILMRIKNLKES